MATRREDLRLPDGTPLDEATSALIKTLRRGWELDALDGRRSWRPGTHVWRTLATFAAEDVGQANPQALPLVIASRIAWEKHAEQSSGRPPLVLLANVVLVLARSPKSREAIDLAESMRHLVERGCQPAMPEYAVDLHTARGGAETPREERLRQWPMEGPAIVPDEGPKDWAQWILRRAAQRGRLDRDEVEAQAQQWQAKGGSGSGRTATGPCGDRRRGDGQGR